MSGGNCNTGKTTNKYKIYLETNLIVFHEVHLSLGEHTELNIASENGKPT